jgi:hypothetical protein
MRTVRLHGTVSAPDGRILAQRHHPITMHPVHDLLEPIERA